MPSPKPATAASASRPSSTGLPPLSPTIERPPYLLNTEPLELEAVPLQVALLTAEMDYLRQRLSRAEATLSYLVKRDGRYAAR
jgi:hypothetical protein